MDDESVDRHRGVSGNNDEISARGICPEHVHQVHLREVGGTGDQGLCGSGRITADNSFEVDALFLKQLFLLGYQKGPVRSGEDDVAVVHWRKLEILLRLSSGG